VLSSSSPPQAASRPVASIEPPATAADFKSVRREMDLEYTSIPISELLLTERK